MIVIVYHSQLATSIDVKMGENLSVFIGGLKKKNIM